MRWRLLPAWGAWALGLRGHAVFLLPWLGLWAWLSASAYLLAARSGDRRLAAAGAVILGTSGGAITSTTWLGVNDGWYLLGLSVVVLARTRWGFVAVCLLCPWVDERFLIALPLALACRWWLRTSAEEGSWRADLAWAGCLVAFYACLRLSLSLRAGNAQEDGEFVRDVFLRLAPGLGYVSLGWFMGWRAAWVLAAVPLLAAWQQNHRREALGLGTMGGGMLLLMILLATDVSRSATMAVPLVLAGLLTLGKLSWVRLDPHRLAYGIAALNLLLPYLHVSAEITDIVNSLPFEIVRLWRAD